MKPIGGSSQAILQATQPSPPKLAVGENIQALVLGSSRRGISIQIGQETFLLDVPSRMANAKTLTLQGTGLSSASAVQVKVVATDDRPLSRATLADLTTKPQPSPPTVSAIVQTSGFKVVAQPLSPDGKVLGASVALHLQALPKETSSKAMIVTSPSVAENRFSKPPDLPPRAPIITQQQNGAPVSPSNQTRVGAAHNRETGNEGAKPLPTRDGAVQENRQRTVTSAAALPSPLPSVSKGPAVDIPRSQGDLTLQHQNAATPIQSEKGEEQPVKGTAALVAATYRSASGYGSVIDAKTMPQAVSSLDRPSPTGRQEPQTAVVIERTSAGRVLLETEGQIFRIEQPIDLPPGMMLEVTGVTSASALATSINPRMHQDQAAPLTRLIELLNDIDRAGRQAAAPDQPSLEKQLPVPDKNLATRFLSLIAAEDMGAFEDDLLPLSDRQRATAVQRDQLQALARELGSAASESLSEGWKGQTLPLGTDQSQAVFLYFRDQALDPDDQAFDEEAEQAETQRAVFDVSFSQLGRCQIDALCQERRFDLLIRSEKSLPEVDRQDIAALFASASEIAGMHGDIVFKVGSFFEPARSPLAVQDLRT